MNGKSFLSFLFVCIVLLAVACKQNDNSKGSQNEQSALQSQKKNILDLSSFFSSADSMLGDTVIVKGIVDHVCKHSGKRFKIIDEEGKNEIRIEMPKEFPSFDPTNVGKEVIVTGKAIPTKLYIDDIEIWEKQIIKNHEEEKEIEHFEEEIKLVREIKDKITSGEIEHHTIYRIEAISYEILSE